MNMVGIYLLQIVVTAALSLVALLYLGPHLERVLVDLCGSRDRAHFWVVFSNILLFGLPLIFSLGYNPSISKPAMLFFNAAGQVRFNLLGFLLALIGIGGVISFFTLVSPRTAGK